MFAGGASSKGDAEKGLRGGQEGSWQLLDSERAVFTLLTSVLGGVSTTANGERQVC